MGTISVIESSRTRISEKNFEKSAQFFDAFIKNYPDNERLDDQLLFYAGVSSYESV